MKKLNMNEPGTLLFYWAMIFLILIPLLLKVISWMFRFPPLQTGITASLIIGGLILFILFVLVGIELKQDNRMNCFYEMNNDVRMKISERVFECQRCGNRKVRETDWNCTVCGVRFKN